jgi:hypothetical protein
MQDLRTVRAKSFSVRGQVVDEAGQAMAIDYAQLFQLGSGQSYRTSPLTQNRTTFEFVGVLPGVYQLKATGAPGATEKVGSLNVTLSNEDIENIRLVMGPAIEVKGRIVQEGGAVPSTIRVQLRSVNGSLGVQLNPTAADGSFTVTRLTPGDYRLIIFEMPANSYVRSAKIGTRDVSSLPLHIEGPITDQLDIVLAATTSSVDALVTDRGKQPVAAAIVVLVPNIERRQRFELYRTATTDATGRASLASIAPGNYKLFAWQDIEPNAWQNAAALAPFEERGVPITIIENGKVNQVITVID